MLQTSRFRESPALRCPERYPAQAPGIRAESAEREGSAVTSASDLRVITPPSEQRLRADFGACRPFFRAATSIRNANITQALPRLGRSVYLSVPLRPRSPGPLSRAGRRDRRHRAARPSSTGASSKLC